MSPTSGKLKPKSDSKTARSILLCGASVRSLAESAIAAGFRPICVDFFEDADLKLLLSSGRGRFACRIRSFAELPERIRSIRNSLPLVWGGGLENYPDVLREISCIRPVVGATSETIEQLRNPWTIKHWLGSASIGCPHLAKPGNADADCHWIRKSVRSSGGLGVGPQTDRQPFEDTIAPEKVYLQEYIDGVPMSALLCADTSGVELLGTSLQLVGWPSLGASGFLFCGNIGPVNPGDALNQQLLEAANILVERSGLRGIFGIDFILRQGRAWLIEVNPRVTASHMLYELQRPGVVTQRHLAASGWNPVRIRRSKERPASCFPAAESPIAGRWILWARNDIRISPNFGDDLDSTIVISDRPQSGTKVLQANPLCSIQLKASNIEDAANQLRMLDRNAAGKRCQSFDTLRQWGYSFRTISDQLLLLWEKFTFSR